MVIIKSNSLLNCPTTDITGVLFLLCEWRLTGVALLPPNSTAESYRVACIDLLSKL